MTYKPKWAGYYIVNIFILSLDLFVHVTIIKNIQYNTIPKTIISHLGIFLNPLTSRIQIYWCRSSIFRHLKLVLLTQFPASNDEKYINVVYI